MLRSWNVWNGQYPQRIRGRARRTAPVARPDAAPRLLVGVARLCGDVARHTNLPRSAVAGHLTAYAYLSPPQLGELSAAWLEGWDGADGRITSGDPRFGEPPSGPQRAPR
jgi:hypothetical protein